MAATQSVSHAGKFTISLDFELSWGVRDSPAFEHYRSNLLGVWQAVPALLDLFLKYEIHATWATVGLLFCNTRKEALAVAPSIRPRYQNQRLGPYRGLQEIGASEAADLLHYAPSLIAMIRRYPHQEIASHTFSHYYCLEPGQNCESFEDDLKASIAVAGRVGIQTSSLVFPRNQVNERYLSSCARLGVTAYRGNPRPRMYRAGRASAFRRLLRLADAYFPFSGDNSYPLECSTLPFNIPASRFLRPYSKRLAPLDGLRLRRICRDLTSAAEKGRMYHLWWHPHNFGVNLRENLCFLEAVLRHFAALRDTCGMQSLNMAECAASSY